MRKNIGNFDKIIRIVIGIGLIAYGLIEQSLFGLIGLIPIITVLISWCPLYTLCNLSTCKIKNKGQSKDD